MLEATDKAYNLMRSALSRSKPRAHLSVADWVKLLALPHEPIIAARRRLGHEGFIDATDDKSLPIDDLVWSGFVFDLESEMKLDLRDTSLRLVRPTLYVRQRLGTTDPALLAVTQRGSIDGKIICTRTAYHIIDNDGREPSPEYVQRAQSIAQIRHNLDTAFEALYRRPVGEIFLAAESVHATADVARDLEVARGTAVLFRETLVTDQEGRPCILGHAHFRAEYAVLPLQ